MKIKSACACLILFHSIVQKRRGINTKSKVQTFRDAIERNRIDLSHIQTVESELTLTGKISFNEDKVARVFPLAGGFVKDLNVELGDHVKKGQVMAIIRSPEIAGFTGKDLPHSRRCL